MKAGQMNLVKMARVRSGMEQQQAAAAGYVSKGTQSKYESGKLRPSTETVKAWNKTLIGRTVEFYRLLCSRCEIGQLEICDGTKCPVGQALDRRQKMYADLKVA
jgi:transcriptional regulator with XRE-family HTH domain